MRKMIVLATTLWSLALVPSLVPRPPLRGVTRHAFLQPVACAAGPSAAKATTEDPSPAGPSAAKATTEDPSQKVKDLICPADGPSVSELLRFTLPTLSALLSSEVMSVIDTAVVGASSSKELAALGPAIMLTDSSAYLFFWLNVACTNLVASALAKEDADEAFKSLSDTLWCAATIGVVMSVLLYFFGARGRAPPAAATPPRPPARALGPLPPRPAGPAGLAALTTKAPETLAAASTYLRLRLFTLPALILTMVLQAACTGSKDAVSPLIAVIAGAPPPP